MLSDIELPLTPSPDRTVRPSAQWLAVGEQSIFHWHYPSVGPARALCLLVSPPAHEGFHSHRFYKFLALALQQSGYDVVRFDLPGYGHSSGDLYHESTHDSWLNAIESLCQQYAQQKPRILLGLRFGANLAAQVSADHYVLIDPINRPKRYRREIQVTAMTAEQTPEFDAGLESGGFAFPEALLNWIETLPTRVANQHADVNVYTDQPSLNDNLWQEPTQRQHRSQSGLEDLLAEPQYVTIPEHFIEQIVSDLPMSLTPDTHETHFTPSIQAVHRGNGYQETGLIDTIGQFGVLCQPQGKPKSERLLLLLNSGSGSCSGPNRLYTEICRSLAREGISSWRVDLKNLGDSADSTVAQENHCYPDAVKDYTRHLLDFIIQQQLAKQVTVAGLCSGAHHAFHTALLNHPGVQQAILINPLTFYWHNGMSLATPKGQQTTIDSSYYSRTVRSGTAWKKLLSGKADYGYIAGFAARLMQQKTIRLLKSMRRLVQPVPVNRLTNDLNALALSKTPLHVIVAEQDPGWGLLSDSSDMPVVAIKRRFPVTGSTVPDANHTFSTRATREALCSHLLAALQQVNEDNS